MPDGLPFLSVSVDLVTASPKGGNALCLAIRGGKAHMAAQVRDNRIQALGCLCCYHSDCPLTASCLSCPCPPFRHKAERVADLKFDSEWTRRVLSHHSLRGSSEDMSFVIELSPQEMRGWLQDLEELAADGEGPTGPSSTT